MFEVFQQWESIFDECGAPSVGEDGRNSAEWYDCSHRILFSELYNEQQEATQPEKSDEQRPNEAAEADQKDVAEEQALRSQKEEEEKKAAEAQRASQVEAYFAEKGALAADEVRGVVIKRFQRLLVECPVDAVRSCIQEQQKQEDEEARSGRKRGFKSIEDELIARQLEFACILPLYDWSRCTARLLSETRVLEELDSCVRMHNLDDRETVLKVFCGKELIKATALWATLGHQVAATLAELSEEEYRELAPSQRQMSLVCGPFLQQALRSYLASKS